MMTCLHVDAHIMLRNITSHELPMLQLDHDHKAHTTSNTQSAHRSVIRACQPIRAYTSPHDMLSTQALCVSCCTFLCFPLGPYHMLVCVCVCDARCAALIRCEWMQSSDRTTCHVDASNTRPTTGARTAQLHGVELQLLSRMQIRRCVQCASQHPSRASDRDRCDACVWIDVFPLRTAWLVPRVCLCTSWCVHGACACVPCHHTMTCSISHISHICSLVSLRSPHPHGSGHTHLSSSHTYTRQHAHQHTHQRTRLHTTRLHTHTRPHQHRHA